jgi:hypothetical protein
MSLWYYRNADGAQVGPFSDQEFRELRESGTVRDTTQVWCGSWTDWSTFAEVWLRGEPTTPEEDAPIPATLGESMTVGNAIPPPFRLKVPIEEERFQEITYANCSVCRQKWPEHLLFGNSRLYMCAPCLKAHEEKRKDRERSRDRGVGFNSELIKWVYKILLLGLVMGGGVVVFLHFLKDASK